MNKHKYLLLFCAGILLSCSKYLDKKPDNLLTEDQIWQTRANAEAYLNNIYSTIYNTDGGDYATMGAADESSVSIGTVNVRQMVGGNWSVSSGYFYNWSGYYSALRKSFIFEQNIDKVPAVQLSSDLKAQYKAENLFLRGYFYWMLLKQYGPYVKVTGLFNQDEDFNKFPRAPFDTCVTYINQLMDQAMQGLPSAWSSSSNLGRPTKGSCMAVKVKAAILGASPLWNGNPNFAGFKNLDGTALAPATADVNRWKTAADAARRLIDSAQYKLFTNLDNGGTVFNPYESVRDVHLTNWNDEIIFANVGWNRWGWTKCASPGPGAYNMYNATQNLVDAFSMINGRTIDDPASTYVETGFAPANSTATWGGHRKGEWNMYANREPRFYANIMYNARPVVPAQTVDDKNYFSSDNNIDGTGRVEFYYNGKSGQKSSGSNNITGYLPLKRISPNSNIRQDNVSFHGPYILIRYAEILLDYVEALNEYDPNNADIVKYLNMIRTRAGIPGIEAVYPDAVGNTIKMREHILRERQVELCFESDRYYTLVRRLLLGQAKYTAIYGLDVNANDNGMGFSFTDFYKRKLFQQRFWDNKMYLFPIHLGDIERDRALVQNPGW
ncbi:RagB/SusD family nutrient uptake outer membrane protein [Chitinophaga sp. SYP-B3965]|uniref:RagB/SusD family nutrient uptake outer membrane protein n=1 Tax=Chitinophaga sp. SYP-B3965 TaxID=2663120 RepID=UPI001299DC4A|nr:RagB/SusD family nutrient uptake outer membrane protein [Chitinophaga sp. SYP-B3965]MRG48269.1 RagB/SusD family nutrient uptake outer membrane protein [Chitinophaga sp. SYP-B3965]